MLFVSTKINALVTRNGVKLVEITRVNETITFLNHIPLHGNLGIHGINNQYGFKPVDQTTILLNKK
jgi:hypothetical protein